MRKSKFCVLGLLAALMACETAHAGSFFGFGEKKKKEEPKQQASRRDVRRAEPAREDDRDRDEQPAYDSRTGEPETGGGGGGQATGPAGVERNPNAALTRNPNADIPRAVPVAQNPNTGAGSVVRNPNAGGVSIPQNPNASIPRNPSARE